MKIFKLCGLLLFVSLYPVIAQAQKGDEYTLGQIGWTFSLPDKFVVQSWDAVTKEGERGKRLLEKSTGQIVGPADTRTLVSAKKDDMNYFNCTIALFDPANDGDWNAADAEIRKIVYDSYHQEMTNALIDSVTTKATIDGVTFNKFTINMKVRAKHFVSTRYSKLYRGYNLAMTFTYADLWLGRSLQEMLDHSKFKK